MKKLILLILTLLGLWFYFRSGKNGHSLPLTGQNATVRSLTGRVDGNVSILERSAYKLVNLKDTTQTYYIIAQGHAPAVGETLTVAVKRQALAVFNNDTLALYHETGPKNKN